MDALKTSWRSLKWVTDSVGITSPSSANQAQVALCMDTGDVEIRRGIEPVDNWKMRNSGDWVLVEVLQEDRSSPVMVPMQTIECLDDTSASSECSEDAVHFPELNEAPLGLVLSDSVANDADEESEFPDCEREVLHSPFDSGLRAMEKVSNFVGLMSPYIKMYEQGIAPDMAVAGSLGESEMHSSSVAIDPEAVPWGDFSKSSVEVQDRGFMRISRYFETDEGNFRSDTNVMPLIDDDYGAPPCKREFSEGLGNAELSLPLRTSRVSERMKLNESRFMKTHTFDANACDVDQWPMVSSTIGLLLLPKSLFLQPLILGIRNSVNYLFDSGVEPRSTSRLLRKRNQESVFGLRVTEPDILEKIRNRVTTIESTLCRGTRAESSLMQGYIQDPRKSKKQVLKTNKLKKLNAALHFAAEAKVMTRTKKYSRFQSGKSTNRKVNRC